MEFTEKDTFEYLDELTKFDEMQQGDLTIAMVMDHKGWAEQTARNRMKKLVKDGHYELLKMNLGGHKRNVYRPIK